MISMIAMPFCSCSSRSRSRICAWVVTSSAVVGSSAISRLGSQESAIAIIARWRRPPLKLEGVLVHALLGRGMPTRRSSSIAALARLASCSPAVQRIASMIWSPMVWTGLNEVIGSWKTSAISPPRIARISRPSAGRA